MAHRQEHVHADSGSQNCKILHPNWHTDFLWWCEQTSRGPHSWDPFACTESHVHIRAFCLQWHARTDIPGLFDIWIQATNGILLVCARDSNDPFQVLIQIAFDSSKKASPLVFDSQFLECIQLITKFSKRSKRALFGNDFDVVLRGHLSVNVTQAYTMTIGKFFGKSDFRRGFIGSPQRHFALNDNAKEIVRA